MEALDFLVRCGYAVLFGDEHPCGALASATPRDARPLAGGLEAWRVGGFPVESVLGPRIARPNTAALIRV